MIIIVNGGGGRYNIQQMFFGDVECGENIFYYYRKGRSVIRRDVVVNDVVLVFDEIIF